MINMKKNYLNPEMSVITLVSEPIMNVVSGETDNVGTGEGSVGDDTEDLVSRKRGEWGDLWK